MEDDYGDVPELVGENDVKKLMRLSEYSKRLTSRLTLRRSSVKREFIRELDPERFAEYVAMGWREPEPQDIGKVVFNRNHKRTEANLIRARQILRESYLKRLGGG